MHLKDEINVINPDVPTIYRYKQVLIYKVKSLCSTSWIQSWIQQNFVLFSKRLLGISEFKHDVWS